MNRKQYLYESTKKIRARRYKDGYIRWEVWVKPEWKPVIKNRIKDLIKQLENGAQEDF